MRRLPLKAVLPFLGLALVAGAAPRPTAGRAGLQALPLSFIQNVGQAEARTAFQASAPGTSLALGSDGIRFGIPYVGHRADPVALRFLGANPAPAIVGEDRLDTHTRFFAGTDRAKWIQDAPAFQRTRYREVYPGTDLVCYGKDGRLEYDWILKPGASPSSIGMVLDGTDSLRVEANGDLVARTPHGEVRQAAPVAYQVVGGIRRTVEARFRLQEGRIGFSLGAYDPGRELVIDPSLAWGNTYATGTAPNYTGGTFEIYGLGGLITASNGDLILAWSDYSEPSGGGSYSTYLHVKRVNSDGTTSGGSTYSATFGGAAFHDDQVRGIAIDGSDNVYLTGYTNDTSFPSTTGSLSGYTGYLLKVSSSGSVSYSSLFAGGTNPNPQSVAVNSSGEAYVCGATTSTSFPTTTGAYQTAHADDQTKNASEGGSGYGTDCWVAKFSSSDGSLSIATYLGGDDQDASVGIAVDGSGSVYLLGSTQSPGLGTSGAYQTSHGNDGYDPGDGSTVNQNDAFVAKFSSDLSSLSWFTYLGAESEDEAKGLALDSSGRPCLVLSTYSSGMPTTSGAFQTSHASDGGSNDAYVAKLSTDGATLVTGSYFGGTGDEEMDHVALDSQDNFLISGTTALYVGGSNSLPAVNNLYSYDDTNGSPFFARITGDGRYTAMSTSLSNGTSYGTGSPLPDGTQNVLGLAWDATDKQVYVSGTSGTFNNVKLTAAALSINTAPCLGNATLASANAGSGLSISYSDLVTASHAEDPDGDAFTFTVQTVNSGTLTKGGTPVTAGTTTLATGETLVWTPDAATVGGAVNAFTYSASDGTNTSGTFQASGPVVDVTAPDAGTPSVTGTSGTITLADTTATDAVGVTKIELYVDGGLVSSASASTISVGFDSTTLANGSHTLVAKAYDAANNAGTSSGVSFSVSNADTTPPSLTNLAESGTSGTITFTCTAADLNGVTQVTYYVDGIGWRTSYKQPFTCLMNAGSLTNGTHSLKAKAWDSSGNSVVAGPLSFTIANGADSTAPTISVAETGTSGTLTLSCTVGDNVGVVHVDYYIDGILWRQSNVSSYTCTLPSTALVSGSHTLVGKARDAAGNVGTSTPVSFTVDNGVDAVSPTVGGVNVASDGTTLTMSSTPSDDQHVARVEYIIDGVGWRTSYWAPWTALLPVASLPSGSHTLVVKVWDEVGNTGLSSPYSFSTP